MDINTVVIVLLWTVVNLTRAAMELPKFNQLLLLYPGYYHFGGTYRDQQVVGMVTGNESYVVEGMDNTASLRLSRAFNRYGGRHALGETPVYLSRVGQDSIPGSDGQQYIFRNTAFGPFLAAKYGNPTELYKHTPHESRVSLDQFLNKQGIMRLVSYKHDHADGHIGLWDCDHFFQSRDWTNEHHMIAVEFWETPDSHCPPKVETPQPRFETVDNVQIIARHNYPSGGDPRTSRRRLSPGSSRKRHQRPRQPDTGLWLQ